MFCWFCESERLGTIDKGGMHRCPNTVLVNDN